MVTDRTTDPVVGEVTAQSVVRTVPAHDELHGEEGSLVLVDGRAQLLSLVGALVRDAARDGAAVADVAAYLESEIGAPPEGEVLDLTLDAVRALVAAELLTVEG